MRIAKLPDRAVAPITTDLDGWRKVSGDPSMRTWIEYKSEDGAMIAGWWEATTGVYHATYAAWEFVHVIEGRIVITEDGGAPVLVGPGDAFVVEPGFAGTWAIEQTVLKHFTIKLK